MRAAAAKGVKAEHAGNPEAWWNNAATLDNSTAYLGNTSGVYVTNAVPMTQTYTTANLGL